MPSSKIQETAANTESQPRAWIGWRAIVLAMLLAPFTAYWTTDQVVDVIFSLMIPPVVMTMLVAICNLGIRRIAPKYALTEGELIIFYAMNTVIGTMCAEWMGIVNPQIYSYALFAKNNTNYQTQMLPYLSKFFVIPEKNAYLYHDFKHGGYNVFYSLAHLDLWWRYIFAWTLLVSLICIAMLCINSLMREEWTNRERLAFPIIQVPLAVVRAGVGKEPLWKNKYFTISFLVMFSIDILNGFHTFYPNLPWLNVRFIGDVSQFFPNPPFNAIGWTPIGIFPYMAVIGFFMPTDLLFSAIFFFFVRKAIQVFTYSIGYTDSAGVFGGGGLIPSPPYFSEQSWGAFIALFVGAAWTARNYLKEVWQQILHGADPNDSGISPRIAFAGLLISVTALFILGVSTGVPLWIMVISTILFLMFSVALTRMRAQIGAPSHEMAFMGPNQMIFDSMGTSSISQSVAPRMISTLFIMNRIHRTHPMPAQLEAMKMGEMNKINQKSLFIALVFAIVFGSVLGHIMHIIQGYANGATDGGGDVAGVVSSLDQKHTQSSPTALLFVVIGFSVVILLDFIRFQVPGFPLHPVGYALAMNFGLDYFWFGLMIVYFIKLFVERYYGLKGHDHLHQVAIGIILAEFSAEAIWSLYSMTHHNMATYSISINGRLAWNQ